MSTDENVGAAQAARGVDGLAARFDAALEEMEQAPEFAKRTRQADVFQAAQMLLRTPEGTKALLERAGRFDDAGVFKGGPWEHADRLLPRLVGGGLKAEGVNSIAEAMSELRMLAVATGRGRVEGLSEEDARSFLREVLVLNLDLLFGAETEEARARPEVFARAERVLGLIGEELSLEGLRAEVIEEVDFICAQRPIVTDRAKRLIREAAALPGEDTERFLLYKSALDGPTPLSAANQDHAAYRAALESASAEEVERELEGFVETLRGTGIGSSHHATLLRHLTEHEPKRIPDALGLDASGVAEADEHLGLCRELIAASIFPETAYAIYGLARLLERGLLSRREVAGGVRRLKRLELQDDVRSHLESRLEPDHEITPNGLLLAGGLAVLGQPLGVGQGHNPTCQAARGISLWSQHAPGFLLDMTTTAARDGVVHMNFEGADLQSNLLPPGLGGDAIDPDIDPLSMVLTPHLDRIYGEMMRRAAARGEDAHKWVNRAMYGRWIPREFSTCINAFLNAIGDYDGFARLFFATHHPKYNGGRELIYPNPVGIFVTDIHGRLLGAHAVTVLRVGPADADEPRVYFFNPNNEGRQQWGDGVSPAVKGHGEKPGESSLELSAFVSRLYAFHYNPYEQGDPALVPAEPIQRIAAMARESWGQAYGWMSEGAA